MKNHIRFVFTVMFAAVISAGCFISIPVGASGIPIVLQNMFVITAACTLGGTGGFWASIIFISAGILGLPVFSGARGGLAHLMGPTGGFIIGYAAGALAAGLIAGKPSPDEKKPEFIRMARTSLAAAAGFMILYIPGILWFMHRTGKGPAAALTLCVIPYIPGDIIKAVLTVALCAKTRPAAAAYMEKK